MRLMFVVTFSYADGTEKKIRIDAEDLWPLFTTLARRWIERPWKSVAIHVREAL